MPIIDSSRGDAGYSKVKDKIAELGFLNVERKRYVANTAGAAPNCPHGKLLVKFEPHRTNGGGTTHVYWYADNPIASLRSNRDG